MSSAAVRRADSTRAISTTSASSLAKSITPLTSVNSYCPMVLLYLSTYLGESVAAVVSVTKTASEISILESSHATAVLTAPTPLTTHVIRRTEVRQVSRRTSRWGGSGEIGRERFGWRPAPVYANKAPEKRDDVRLSWGPFVPDSSSSAATQTVNSSPSSSPTSCIPQSTSAASSAFPHPPSALSAEAFSTFKPSCSIYTTTLVAGDGGTSTQKIWQGCWSISTSSQTISRSPALSSAHATAPSPAPSLSPPVLSGGHGPHTLWYPSCILLSTAIIPGRNGQTNVATVVETVGKGCWTDKLPPSCSSHGSAKGVLGGCAASTTARVSLMSGGAGTGAGRGGSGVETRPGPGSSSTAPAAVTETSGSPMVQPMGSVTYVGLPLGFDFKFVVLL
ncbi:hypothetical protein K432DRAFT_446415 [Lepidopterella palustris CBS 459.81]|uniref:Uncharacterized protein n=1 Tax=Lepidopterella palustris CBS 459.81 TaxID=1314670 RepID=A0A8E2E1X5_9PEZI|nr:hypothetical protein K432DRAFT_446415 [Lepidopterella palustris CBS 459.81]